MEARSDQSGEKKKALDLKNLSAFAGFLLTHKLNEFASYVCSVLFETNLPLQDNSNDPKNHSRHELEKLSVQTSQYFLRYARENNTEKYISESINEWTFKRKRNPLPDQAASDNILLVTHAIKKALLHYLPDYTVTPGIIIAVAEEAEEYSLQVHNALVSTYVSANEQSLRDMTDKHEKNRASLLEAQAAAQVGSFYWDLSGAGRSEFSEQVYQIFEMENFGNIQEFFGKIHPADREKVSEALQEAIRGSGVFESEYRYISKSGEKIIWSKGVVVNKKEAGAVLQGVVMDVTGRHYTISRLERNERLYKQAQALAHIGNWTYEVITEKFSCSDELYRILGFSPGPEVELTFDRFMNIVHPGDKDLILEKFFDLAKGISVEDIVAWIETENGETKYIKGNGRILKDSSGKPYKVIGTCQDITKEMKLTRAIQHREELLEELNNKLNEKNLHLESSNKELSAFGYVVSHDLQEPLRKIKLFGDLLLDKENANLSEEGKMLLGRIINSSGRMQKLINDLLSFSRTQTGDKTFEKVDLNSVLDGIMNFYEESVNRKKPVIIKTELPVISGIAFQVQQLFENIISNSVKYSKADAECRVRVWAELAEETTLSGPSRYYKICVEDNGIGFEQKYASKIFEIFQRLHGKAEYSGTGIGLSICKKIMENHSGKIEAFGVPQQGARFDIYFPIAGPSTGN